MTTRLACVLLLVLCPTAVFGQADIQIDVTAAAPAPVLAIAPPHAESAGVETVRREIQQVLDFDLTFSKAVCVLNDAAAVRRQTDKDRSRDQIDYGAWKGMGVQYVVDSSIRRKGETQLEVDVLVYDVRDQRRLMGVRVTAAQSRLRDAIHKLSDRVVYECTRVDGIAQTSLLFVHHDPVSRTKDIFIVDYDGWPGSIRPLTRYGTITQFPSWSASGQEFAFCSFRSGWLDAYIQDLTSGKTTFLAKAPGNNLTPSWLPKNRNQLVISLSYLGNPEIFLIRKDGTQPRRLTKHPAIDTSPKVSPDESQIVFTSDRSRVATLYLMDARGENVRRLVSDTRLSCDTAEWSPVPINGTYRIAFRGYRLGEVRGDIYTIAVDGTDLVNLTGGRGDNSNPTWSPDGSYIAFSTVRRSGKSELWVMERDGDAPRRLLSLKGNCLQPAWGPRAEAK